METIVRCLILSTIMGISCSLFFETFLPRRVLPFPCLNHLQVFWFTAGFLLIAFTPIPPYILQPVRFILTVTLAAHLCFQAGLLKKLILSTTLCSIFWIITSLFLSVVSLFPSLLHTDFSHPLEYLESSIFLCLTIIFHYRFKAHAGRWADLKWSLLSFFPLFSIVVIVAMIMALSSEAFVGNYAIPASLSGFAAINICFFYFIVKSLEKEEETRQLRLLYEHTQKQMAVYRSVRESHSLQSRQLHDYRNHLECIQGMLENGQASRALAYVAGLTGSLSQNVNFINTGHNVVNIILNRKYQEACKEGITLVPVVNDLSGLTINEEEIVVLLGNLLDNAVAACRRLDDGKIIRFKMTLEDGQMILSVSNPVKEPVPIRQNRVLLPKAPFSLHGIGLRNVESVVRKNNGTSVLKCENGWFFFSAMIPLPPLSPPGSNIL